MCVCLAACSTKNENTSVTQPKTTSATEAAQTSEPTEATKPVETTSAQTAKTEAAQTDQTETAQPDKTEGTSVEQSENVSDALTENQALDAIKNYCLVKNPDLKSKVDSTEYTVYWDVKTNDSNEIVVLFRSYTGAQIRYYIDPVSGATYVTELVPGIIDEEQRTEESLNARDYLE